MLDQMPSPITLTEVLRNKVDAAINDVSSTNYTAPDPLSPVMSYAMAGKGKRVRPLFCLLAAQSYDVPAESCLRAAVALEMIHTYCLVHDDLPCMDNDSMRRGRPSTHVEFDEAQALLAGDSLLTDAFTLITSDDDDIHLPSIDIAHQAQVVKCLAESAGSKGTALGQSWDLYWTKKSGMTLNQMRRMHELKTGNLLGCAAKLGAIIGDATKHDQDRYFEFGVKIGLAFQILDDVLDNREGTGKSRGKDLVANKTTALSFLSENQARTLAQELTSEAIANLENTNPKSKVLCDYALSLLERHF